jgi:uncharacterized membrane protein
VIGRGSFNLVEGVVDHEVLGLHHVRESAADPFLWDTAFLAFGVCALPIDSSRLPPPGAILGHPTTGGLT